MPSQVPPVVYITYFTAAESPLTISQPELIRTPADISIRAKYLLPFDFPFFGQLQKYLYITAKGAVTFNPTPPCYIGPSCFKSFTSYQYFVQSNIPYRTIAAYYSNLQLGSISYGNTNSQVVISYSNMTYQNSSYSFQILLSSTGQITLNYLEMGDSNPVSYGDNVPLAGIVEQSYNTNVKLTPDQAQSSKVYLGLFNALPSLMLGVFPDPALVQTDSAYHFCPISTLWFIQPAIFNLSDATSVNTPVTLTALSHGCVETVSILLASRADLQHATSTTCTLNRTTTTSSNSTLVQYSCNISTLLSTASPALYLAWQPLASSPVQLLPVSPLYLNYTSSSINNNNSNTDSIITTTLLPLCTSTLAPSVCSGGCDLLNSSTSCLAITCANTSLALADYLYAVQAPSRCGNTCSMDFFVDFNNNCCPVSQLDCTGTCGGLARTALNTDGELTCCASGRRVDCLGICAGTAIRDACGVCGGTDYTSSTCSTNFTVSPVLNSFTTAMASSLDFALVFNAAGASTPSLQPHLNISNTGDSFIYIQISVSGNSHKAPVISILDNTVFLPPASSFTVRLTADIHSLFTTDVAFFEPKRISIQYQRVNTSDIALSMSFMVYPVAANCSSVLNYRHCANLPGCVYCLSYPTQRLLIEDILPFAYHTYNADYSYGSCVEGWDLDVCDAVLALANLNSAASSGRSELFNTTTLALTMLLIMLMMRL